MKKNTIISLLILLSVLTISIPANAQVLSMRTGVKLGMIACNYDHDDNGEVSTGTGMHFGLGMGTDLFRIVGLDLTPQYRTTKYSRSVSWGRKTYFYNNIYFPVFLSLRGSFIPFVSPYIGLGIGINIIVGGHERDEYPNGTVIETPLSGSSTQGVAIVGGGLEFKLSKLRLIPEFTANITGSGDEANPPQPTESNYHISLGVYYAP